MISQEIQTVPTTQVMPVSDVLKDYEVGKMSPAQVRQTVAALVAEEKTEIAVALCEAALAVYPSEQDILAVYALVCEIKQDWAMSEQCLVQLIHAQGADSGRHTVPGPTRCTERRARASAWGPAKPEGRAPWHPRPDNGPGSTGCPGQGPRP